MVERTNSPQFLMDIIKGNLGEEASQSLELTNYQLLPSHRSEPVKSARYIVRTQGVHPIYGEDRDFIVNLPHKLIESQRVRHYALDEDSGKRTAWIATSISYVEGQAYHFQSEQSGIDQEIRQVQVTSSTKVGTNHVPETVAEVIYQSKLPAVVNLYSEGKPQVQVEALKPEKGELEQIGLKSLAPDEWTALQPLVKGQTRFPTLAAASRRFWLQVVHDKHNFILERSGGDYLKLIVPYQMGGLWQDINFRNNLIWTKVKRYFYLGSSVLSKS